MLKGPPRSPSEGAVEVVDGMAVEGVMVGMVFEVVVVGVVVEGENEGMAAEEVMVEVMEGVTVELSPW